MMRGKTILLLLATLGVAACASQPIDDNYYSLVLAADDANRSDASADATRQLLVGPVLLPDYLDRRGIVMQFGSSRVLSANHHFWAEPLDEGIGKVLVQDVAKMNAQLFVDREVGRQTANHDCRLGVEFDKFHATDKATVVSSGRYWLTSNADRVRREFDLTQRLSADGYGHAVDALRESLRSVAKLVSQSIDESAICADESR